MPEDLLGRLQFIKKSGLLLIVESLGAGVLVQDDPNCLNYNKNEAYRFIPSLEALKHLVDSRDLFYVNEQLCHDHATPEFISRYWQVRTIFAEANLLDIFFQILEMSDMDPTVTFTEESKTAIASRVQNDKLWLPPPEVYRLKIIQQYTSTR